MGTGQEEVPHATPLVPEQEEAETSEEGDGEGKGGFIGSSCDSREREGERFHQRKKGAGEVDGGRGRDAEELLDSRRQGDGRWLIGEGSICGGGVAGGDRKGGL